METDRRIRLGVGWVVLPVLFAGCGVNIVAPDCNFDGVQDPGELCYSIPSQEVFDGGVLSNPITADFDLDGDLDLAAATGVDTLALFFNEGNGELFTREDLPLDSIGSNLSTGDINGDGAVDIVATSLLDTEVFLLVNDGLGNFTPDTLSLDALVGEALPVDVNGDARLDLVVGGIAADLSDGVTVFLNLGEGLFGEPRFFESPGSVGALAAGDFDGDGDTDIATTSFNSGLIEDAAVIVFENDGAGDLGSSELFPIKVQGPSGIAAGDLDDDGDIDLVGGCGNCFELSVLPNDGSGRFTALRRLRVFPDGGPASSPSGVTLANIDGQDGLEILSLQTPEEVGVMRNNGSGRFRDVALLFFSPDAGLPVGLTTGDLNGDGLVDLVRTTTDFSLNSGAVEVLLAAP